ncbi:MAG: hypothetical protein Q7S45_04705 [Candidatus Curtissbacteria bacterium]|nr:hypothetical protein [Candidatus Curtissbacteria bacterium]
MGKPQREETMKSPNHAWLFDVDGVITHPEKKQVVRKGIFTEIIKRLKLGEPVALVTGRALSWVMERVVNPLSSEIDDKTVLDRLFVSGEFGASRIQWKNGKPFHGIDSSISLPKKLAEEARKAAEAYKDTQHIDPDKETMVSIEMNDGLTVDEFRRNQLPLAKRLNEILASQNAERKFEVHVDRIATNVRHKAINKHYAAQQVIRWLSKIGLSPKQFFAFGDSAGDREMADELHREGKAVTFVFVGHKEELGSKGKGYKTVITEEQCDDGTVEFLKSKES